MNNKTLRLQQLYPFEILEESNQTNNIPVNLFSICDTFNVKIKQTDFSVLESQEKYRGLGKILGAVYRFNNQICLCVNKDILNQPDKRKANCDFRYTIARQLAHYCLIMDMSTDYVHLDFIHDDSSKKCRSDEAFGCALLIPEESLCYVYNKLLMPSLEFLAQLFEVPARVMRLRLDQLDLPFITNFIP